MNLVTPGQLLEPADQAEEARALGLLVAQRNGGQQQLVEPRGQQLVQPRRGDGQGRVLDAQLDPAGGVLQIDEQRRVGGRPAGARTAVDAT